jgi:diketogulonate reductase-like aldo/keto reductase
VCRGPKVYHFAVENVGWYVIFSAQVDPTAIMSATLKLNNGAIMPTVGFGTWRADTSLLEAAITSALKAGYRHLDCAALYRNEHIVGAGIAASIKDGTCSRADLFITSKLPYATI